MLIQSTPGEIIVLPALPPQWPSGSMKGVRVPGGGKMDVVWKEGRLTELRLQSDHAIKYRITYGEASVEARVEPGKPILLDSTLRRNGH